MIITPDVSVVDSFRRANLTWPVAVKELVDNAFDAGATVIRVEWVGGNEFRITDDGVGADDERLYALAVYGRHHAHRHGNALGRYGVGAKDALGWMWGVVNITTVHKHIRRKLSIDWQRLLDSGKWEIKDPDVSAVGADRSGTKIRVTGHIRRTPTLETCKRVAEEIGFIYHPAIRRGGMVTLSLDNLVVPVAPFRDPPVMPDTKIELSLDVNGKPALLRAWIVPEGFENHKSGITYVHRHRVILPASNLGCGDYNPARVFGSVEIVGDEWLLTRYKDALEEEDRDALAAAVFAVAEPLLKRASGMAEHIQLKDIEMDLAQALRGYVRRLKEKRNPPANHTGKRTPTNTGRKRKRAAKVQAGNGSVEDQLPEAPMLKVQVVQRGADWGYGEYNPTTKTVFLNSDDVNVAAWLRDYKKGGKDKATIGAIALLSLFIDREGSGAQLFMRGLTEGEVTFAKVMSKLLASQLPPANDIAEAA